MHFLVTLIIFRAFFSPNNRTIFKNSPNNRYLLSISPFPIALVRLVFVRIIIQKYILKFIKKNLNLYHKKYIKKHLITTTKSQKNHKNNLKNTIIYNNLFIIIYL